MPEPRESARPEEAAGPPPPPTAPVNPLLSRLELELPDGRYLLAYRHLERAPADA